jgi:hypothetical protein
MLVGPTSSSIATAAPRCQRGCWTEETRISLLLIYCCMLVYLRKGMMIGKASDISAAMRDPVTYTTHAHLCTAALPTATLMTAACYVARWQQQRSR